MLSSGLGFWGGKYRLGTCSVFFFKLATVSLVSTDSNPRLKGGKILDVIYISKGK